MFRPRIVKNKQEKKRLNGIMQRIKIKVYT